MADNLDDAAGAVKKLKQYTAGFDELNVFSPDTASGSGAGVGGEADLNSLCLSMTSSETLSRPEWTRSRKCWKAPFADITVMVSGFALAVGAILVLTGANIPLDLA